jgi:hypothetical protein
VSGNANIATILKGVEGAWAGSQVDRST